MTIRRGHRMGLVVLCILAGGLAALSQTRTSPGESRQGTTVSMLATGPFDVKLTPQKPDNKDAEAANFGRLSIDKQFHGDLEGASKGEMLGARTEVEGPAGYVALERVTGKLNGRSGTFALQHSGTMTRGKLELTVTVVPDSGTDGLQGLTGAMEIIIAEGKHSYRFHYMLPAESK